MVPILINIYVFQLSYDDFKFMVQNHNYFFTLFLIFLLSVVSMFALYNNWVFCIFRCSIVVCIYTYNLLFLTGKLTLLTLCFSLSLVTSILCDIITVILVLFWSSFAWNIFFHLFIFSLYMIFNLKWVSYRKHISGSCFCFFQQTSCFVSFY